MPLCLSERRSLAERKIKVKEAWQRWKAPLALHFISLEDVMGRIVLGQPNGARSNFVLGKPYSLFTGRYREKHRITSLEGVLEVF